MRKVFTGVLAGLVATAIVTHELPVAATEEAEKFEYVGPGKCKMCHRKVEDGEQYRIWSESSHAKAFETLASKEALAEAKKQGIEDPQKAPECLKCHATAFAVMDDLANQKVSLEEGISCESCHGPGSGYAKNSVKKKIASGEIEGTSVGLWEVSEETCKRCHTPEGNPFFKEFVFAERVKKIAHPIPEGSESDEDSD